MEISRKIFDQQRLPRFGNANPERMTLPFWEWMIRGEGVPPINTKSRLGELGFRIEESKLRSASGPFRARDAFNIPLNREDGPIWTFDRMGATSNRLRDGRVIYLGGEHEDFYDPDFYIYNDVVALGPDGRLEIYGYPKEVFPPTDFHSATVVGDRILVVGGLWLQRRTPLRPYTGFCARSIELSYFRDPDVGRDARLDLEARGQV